MPKESQSFQSLAIKDKQKNFHQNASLIVSRHNLLIDIICQERRHLTQDIVDLSKHNRWAPGKISSTSPTINRQICQSAETFG